MSVRPFADLLMRTRPEVGCVALRALAGALAAHLDHREAEGIGAVHTISVPGEHCLARAAALVPHDYFEHVMVAVALRESAIGIGWEITVAGQPCRSSPVTEPLLGIVTHAALGAAARMVGEVMAFFEGVASGPTTLLQVAHDATTS